MDSIPTPRPECGTKNRAAYDVPIHVFALVLILVLSTLSCAFPIAVRRFPRLPIPHQFLFLSRHFGTGVLIATAFVHLLPTAYTSLTDPCLPPFWNERYPAMPGLIAMTSVFAVVGVEMFFASRGAGHSHGGDFGEYHSLGEGDRGTEMGKRSGNMNGHTHAHADTPGQSEGFPTPRAANFSENGGFPLGGQTYDHAKDEDRESDTESLLAEDPFEVGDDPELGDRASTDTVRRGAPSSQHQQRIPSRRNPSRQAAPPVEEGLLDKAAHSRALLQCLMLEAGILFHSIFIGMALSVATGPPFAVLLVAISFHQTFEGLALGSRISALNFNRGSPQPWFMALAYGTTTPLGQAIGLGVHRLYDPASETGLLVVGITNAVSSGLLLFAGLVELLAEDFLSEKSYQTLQGKKRLQACGSVLAGSALMALVGAWA